MSTIDKAKAIKRDLLARNVRKFLNVNYDWKVTRAVSTGVALSDKDKNFRASVIAEYDIRLAALEAATTLEEIKFVKVTF